MSGASNQDGNIDATDIDVISAALRGGDTSLDFDLNRDGRFDVNDRNYLLDEILNVVPGDANLDGIFDSTDLVEVFRGGKYEDDTVGNAGWADGDWNGDGEFNTADLVAAFSTGRYDQTEA